MEPASTSSPADHGTTGHLRVARDGQVATIWLDRAAKRNAVTYGMWVALDDACRALATDHRVRVVVLRGEGDHFCAGADITELLAPRDPGVPTFMEANMAAEHALATLPKPTVAVVRGDCIGGGAALAIDCDIRLAADTARFGITPAKLGVVYPPPSLERVTRLLGPRAKRLLYTGDLIDAHEALRIGLIDEVLPEAELDHRAAELCATLAQRSLLTQAATKAMVGEVLAHGSVSVDVAEEWARTAAHAPDLAEGVAAFTEKRPPRFTWTGQ